MKSKCWNTKMLYIYALFMYFHSTKLLAYRIIPNAFYIHGKMYVYSNWFLPRLNIHLLQIFTLHNEIKLDLVFLALFPFLFGLSSVHVIFLLYFFFSIPLSNFPSIFCIHRLSFYSEMARKELESKLRRMMKERDEW